MSLLGLLSQRSRAEALRAICVDFLQAQPIHMPDPMERATWTEQACVPDVSSSTLCISQV